jgi:hypothetical protein
LKPDERIGEESDFHGGSIQDNALDFSRNPEFGAADGPGQERFCRAHNADEQIARDRARA